MTTTQRTLAVVSPLSLTPASDEEEGSSLSIVAYTLETKSLTIGRPSRSIARSEVVGRRRTDTPSTWERRSAT
ncbi:hypothetical protein FS842_004502 [Serendipita sp. 407]|nr:hypothetical protein FS842_004502 [Serendipita sp. 407]